MLTRAVRILVIVSSGILHAQTLHGVGSSSPYSLFSEWFKDYGKVNPAVKMHYKPTGSAHGIDQFIEGRADFAVTDAPLTNDQREMARQKLGADVLQIPMMLAAVVPVYTVAGVDVELKFTGAALAGIYLGKITRWNDSEIANANPGVPLPDEKIIVVHRSDSSDITYMWTEFLSKVSPAWRAGPGKGLNVKWPIGLGAKGDDGVEDLVIGPEGSYAYLVDDLVRSISNSIGYVQFHYAVDRKLPYGDVQNASGNFARAAELSIIAEAVSAAKSIPDAYRSSLVDVPSEIGYPISSFIWILVPASMADKEKTKAMADFLKWMLKDGQNSAEALHYVRLPSSIVGEALTEVARLH
ncbi:MAG: phosphate ABC transporter substrate-binding protein PstS [Acidobacteriaceae bacterium]|nr:phosphate ABC transporter substrate-binding protein PstS [Acidobacteriaceae bacterium]